MNHIVAILGMARVLAKIDSDQNLVERGAKTCTRRMALSLSQEALADYAEIDRSHMGKIERGERNVTFLNILRIANALECMPSDLLLDAGL